VACRDIVHDSITKYIVEGVFLIYIFSIFADYYAQFNFVVDLRRCSRKWNLTQMACQSIVEFIKETRRGWDLGTCLFCVLAVIESYAYDFAWMGDRGTISNIGFLHDKLGFVTGCKGLVYISLKSLQGCGSAFYDLMCRLGNGWIRKYVQSGRNVNNSFLRFHA